MAQTILIKRSNTSGAVPTTSQLSVGELALNTRDGKIYMRKYVDGTTGNDTITLIGDTSTIAATTLTGNLSMGDNVRAIFGTGNDLQIYHNATNSVIADTGSGFLSLQSNGTEIALYDTANNANMGRFITGGSVNLFYNGNTKFQTTNTGINVTGTVTANSGGGSASLGSHLDLGDNQKARFGAGDDLQIYHDGSNSFIQDAGTGTLRILSDDVRIMNAAGTEISAQFIQDGEARLKYDNVTKLATTSTGIDVTGSLSANSITLNASGSSNPQITFNNNDFSSFDWFFNQDDSGRLLATVINTGGAEMQLFSDGSDYTNATLHVGGSRVVTANAGIAISTGAITASGNLSLGDNVKARFGASNDLQIYHTTTGNHSIIAESGSGNLILAADNLEINNAANNENKIVATSDGAVTLYFNNASKFATQSYGANLSGVLLANDGSAAAPTFGFSNDSDTGMYRNSADILAFSTGGARRGYWASSGLHSDSNVYIGTGGTFRNYAGVWSATTGTTGNGFSFVNSVDGTAMTLSSTGSAVFSGTISSGDITITGQSSGVEGGQINLLGVGSIEDIHVDNYNGTFRIFDASNPQVRLSLDTSGNGTFSGQLEAKSLNLAHGSQSEPIEGNRFTWMNTGTGTDLNWKKVADVTIGTSLYKALSMTVESHSANSNFGSTASNEISYYEITFYRSAGTQDDANFAKVIGYDTTNHQLRVVKTATGVYELQAKQVNNYKDLILNIQVQSTNSGAVTFTDSIVNGSTTGTFYTASQSSTSNKYLLNRVKTSELTVAGNVTANNLYVADDIGHSGDSDTYISFDNNTHTYYAGGTRLLDFAPGSVIFNEGGGDVDFRVEGVGSSHALFVQGSDGNVGIGTTAPSKKLHVKGTSDDQIIIDSNSASANSGLFFFENGTNKWEVYHRGADNTFRIYNYNTSTADLVISSSGKVGIGTTAPLGKLSVGAGSINDAALPVQISTGADGTQAWYAVNRNGSYGALFGYSASSTYKGLVIRNVVSSGTANADGISFMTNNTSMRMHITGAGNVGIGESIPTEKLHVGGNIKMQATTAIVTYQNAANTWNIGLDAADASFKFKDGTAERIRIDSSGNVGIGTTAPAALLHVKSAGNGEIEVERTSGALINLQAQAAAGYIGTDSNHLFGLKANGTVRLKISTGGAISFNDAFTFPTADGSANQLLKTDGSGNMSWVTVSGAGTPSYIADADGDTKIQVEESSDDDAIRFDTAGAERMIINSAGNIGVGTSGPNESFHITKAGDASIRLQRTGVDQQLRIDQNSIRTTTSSDISIFTSGNARQIFLDQSTGHVGVNMGSSDPQTIFNVKSGGSDDGIYLVRSDNTNLLGGIVQTGSADGALVLRNTSNAQTVLFRGQGNNYITGGSLGIGHTSPVRLLHIKGTGSTVAAKIEATDGNQASLDLTNSEGAFRVITNGGTLQIYDDGDSAERMRIDTSGNVGINQSNPSHKLQVSVDANGAFIKRDLTSNAANLSEFNSHRSLLLLNRNAGSYLAFGGNSSRTDIQATDLAGTPTAKNIALNPFGGNVGIGTTAPSFALDVQAANGNILARFKDSDSSHSGIVIAGDTNAGWVGNDVGVTGEGIYYQSSNNLMRFYTNSAERIRILSDGKVGIGTTSPIAPLTINNNLASASAGTNIFVKSDTAQWVAGDPHVYNAVPDGILVTADSSRTDGPDKMGLVLYNDNNTAGGFSPMLLFAKRETGSTPYRAAMAGIYAKAPLGTGNSDAWIDGQLHFATAGASSQGIKSRMVIDKEGNVGIGTTTPDEFSVGSTYKYLSVGGDKPGIINLVDNSTNGSYLQFGTAAGVRRASIHAVNGSHLAFTVNASNSGTGLTEAMRIKNNGYVGIGESSPIHKLQVNGNIRADGHYYVGGNVVINSSRIAKMAHGTAAAPSYTFNDDDNLGMYRVSADTLGFTTSGTERMRITSGGDVSIGSNHSGFSTWRVLNLRGQSTGALLNYEASDGTRRAAIANSGSELRLQTFLSGASITFESGTGSEKGRINGDGKLLLNATTTAFSDKLYVNGDAYVTGGWRTGTSATFVGELTNASGILTLQTAANRDIQLGDTNNPNIVYVDTSTQKVGIGTTSPDATLRIDNESGVAFKVTGGGLGTTIASFVRDVGANATINIHADSGRPQIAFTSTGNSFAVGVNSNTFEIADSTALGTNTRLSIDNVGKIQIGNNIPMWSGSYGGALVLKGNNATGDRYAQLAIVDSTGSLANNGLVVTNTGLVAIGSTSAYTTGGAAQLSLVGSSALVSMGPSNNDMSYIRRQSAGNFAWQTYNSNNTGSIQLQPYGGNVGVRTTNPVTKLQVDHAGVDTYAVNTSATSAAQVDTFAAATFRTARYTIQVTNTTDSTYHVTELLLIHDGTTPAITEYGTIFTGTAAEATFDADIVSGNVRLLATPASSDTMQFKVVRHSILV